MAPGLYDSEFAPVIDEYPEFKEVVDCSQEYVMVPAPVAEVILVNVAGAEPMQMV